MLILFFQIDSNIENEIFLYLVKDLNDATKNIVFIITISCIIQYYSL